MDGWVNDRNNRLENSDGVSDEKDGANQRWWAWPAVTMVAVVLVREMVVVVRTGDNGGDWGGHGDHHGENHKDGGNDYGSDADGGSVGDNDEDVVAKIKTAAALRAYYTLEP